MIFERDFEDKKEAAKKKEETAAPKIEPPPQAAPADAVKTPALIHVADENPGSIDAEPFKFLGPEGG